MMSSLLRAMTFAIGLVALPAGAEIATFADVRAAHGVRLGAQELRELMPEAKVVSRTAAGSTRRWQNRPDGTFAATSDGRGQSGGRNSYATAEGTWRVTDEGKLCVKIPWPRSPDDWCRYIFRLDGKYYGVGSLSDEAPASEFEFSK
ncbi:MAG TPA: DUF995 domain-containing protein [Casimicrobiaceae bacterium]|nr:DUF995 domain-containing protein [Casimicrobiaceae bacterium]